MIIEIKVPSPGESITEVEIGSWLVADGAVVTKNQEIAEVESDKATLTIIASEAGKIKINAEEGTTIAVGSVVCTIDTSVAPAPSVEKQQDNSKEEPSVEKENPKAEEKVETPKPDKEIEDSNNKKAIETSTDLEHVKVTSLAKEMMKELDLSVEDVINGLKRIGKKEVEAVAGLPKRHPYLSFRNKKAPRAKSTANACRACAAN